MIDPGSVVRLVEALLYYELLREWLDVLITVVVYRHIVTYPVHLYLLITAFQQILLRIRAIEHADELIIGLHRKPLLIHLVCVAQYLESARIFSASLLNLLCDCREQVVLDALFVTQVDLEYLQEGIEEEHLVVGRDDHQERVVEDPAHVGDARVLLLTRSSFILSRPDEVADHCHGPKRSHVILIILLTALDTRVLLLIPALHLGVREHVHGPVVLSAARIVIGLISLAQLKLNAIVAMRLLLHRSNMRVVIDVVGVHGVHDFLVDHDLRALFVIHEDVTVIVADADDHLVVAVEVDEDEVRYFVRVQRVVRCVNGHELVILRYAIVLDVQGLALSRGGRRRDLLQEGDGLTRELLLSTNIDKELLEHNLLALLGDARDLAVERVIGLALGRFAIYFHVVDVDLLVGNHTLLVKILVTSAQHIESVRLVHVENDLIQVRRANFQRQAVEVERADAVKNYLRLCFTLKVAEIDRGFQNLHLALVGDDDELALVVHNQLCRLVDLKLHKTDEHRELILVQDVLRLNRHACISQRVLGAVAR